MDLWVRDGVGFCKGSAQGGGGGDLDLADWMDTFRGWGRGRVGGLEREGALGVFGFFSRDFVRKKRKKNLDG